MIPHAAPLATFSHYGHNPLDPHSLSDNNIISIHEDRSGNLWIGTWAGGLNHFDRKTERFRHYKHNPNDLNSLSSNSITFIYCDRSDQLWIATHYGGLNQFDRRTDSFKRYLHDPKDKHSLSHNGVTVIHEDQAGTLWVGTTGGGLNKFDREKEQFISYTKKDGLPSDIIVGMLEDDTAGKGAGGPFEGRFFVVYLACGVQGSIPVNEMIVSKLLLINQ